MPAPHGTHGDSALDPGPRVHGDALGGHSGHGMSDEMAAPPAKPVSECEAIRGDLLDREVTWEMPGISIPAKVHEDVGGRLAVEIGNGRRIRRVIAVPVVHDEHVFRSVAVLSVTYSARYSGIWAANPVHLKSLHSGLLGQKKLALAASREGV